MKWIFVAVFIASAFAASHAAASEYYKVVVTRKAQDLYEVLGQGLYIKTRFCYEYVYYSEAIVQIDSPYGYSVGTIYFVGGGGAKCDIEGILQ